MQSQHTNNTTNRIYKAFKDFNPSIRLNNIRYFPNNVINNTSFLFKILGLLSLASLEKTQAAITYFSSLDNNQHYQSIITGSSNINIDVGDCGSTAANHTAVFYNQILKNWNHPDYNVLLLQGENEPANNTMQACLVNFIQAQIDALQAQIEAQTEADKAASLAKSKENTANFLIGSTAFCGFLFLIAMACFIKTLWKDISSRKKFERELEKEKNTTNDIILSVVENVENNVNENKDNEESESSSSSSSPSPVRK
jgi:hypothetical protein